MPRRRIIVALLAIALAIPSAVFAQGAGDDQYQDPFGDEQAQNDGGNGGGGEGGSANAAQDEGGLEDEPPVGGDGDDGETDPAPPADEDPADEQPAEEDKALPNTGSDPRMLAFVGVLFLLVGVGLRLRSIDPDAY